MACEAMDVYFSSYASTHNAQVRGGEAMHHEFFRLTTFASWPANAAGWPSALARAGFYYEGKDDETRCFSCKGMASHWSGTDDVFEEHWKLSPHCPFLLGIDTRNIALGTPAGRVPRGGAEHLPDTAHALADADACISADMSYAESVSDTNNSGYTTQSVASSALASARPRLAGITALALTDGNRTVLMKREKVRLLTYHNWPLDNPVLPKDLARAGFYFVGPYDRVKCAFCQNVLRNWVTGDNTEEEHAHYYPDCPFVLGQSAGIQARNVGNVPGEYDTEPGDEILSFLETPPSAARHGVVGEYDTEPGGENLSFLDIPPSSAQLYREMGIMTDRPRHPEFATEFARVKTFATFPAWCPVKPDVLANAGFFFTGSGDCVRCFFCDIGMQEWEPNDEPLEEHARFHPRCNFIRTIKGNAYIQKDVNRFSINSQRQHTTRTAAIFDIEGSLTASEEAVSGMSGVDVKKEATSKESVEMVAGGDVQSVMEENRQWKEQNVCRVCMDNDNSILLLPCRHLCCCSNCSHALRNCPICRKYICGTVTVYK